MKGWLVVMDKQDLAVRRIEQALLEGRWGVLERLPAERQLAEEFGVNRGTLRAALRSLAGRGVLETTRGSGTIVRSIPKEAQEETQEKAESTLRDKIEALKMFMPQVVAAYTGFVTPTNILELERLLPSAGAALHNGDTRGFVQAQMRFFTEILRTLNNPIVAQAASLTLPDIRQLACLLQRYPLRKSEMLFAMQARMLSALRHADADAAMGAAEDYASKLLKLLEGCE